VRQHNVSLKRKRKKKQNNKQEDKEKRKGKETPKRKAKFSLLPTTQLRSPVPGVNPISYKTVVNSVVC
jgi:hypothetical protein